MKKEHFFVLLLLSLIMISCSSKDSISPAIDSSTGNESIHGNHYPLYVSDWNNLNQPIEGMGFLGLFSGRASLDELSFDIAPLRQNALTDTLEIVDITNFLSMAPCTDCVKIKSVGLNENNQLIVSIGIRHPFGVGNSLEPITGKNRADLHVFNVEGIIAAQTESTHAFPILGVSIADSGLANPDGYTNYLDDSLDDIFPTDANTHPYIMHFDDYSEGNFNPLNPYGFESVTTPPPSGNLVMPMGSDYDFKDYVFDFGNNSELEFIFAVGCTYAVSAANKSMRFTPEYRIPQHNKKAASEVWIEVTSNNLVAGDIASTADLAVYVLDINHGAAVGDNLDQMKHESNVAGITIEIPGIIMGAHTDYQATGGDGRDPLNPLTFTATITNSAAGGNGTYHGLVKVLDSYPTGLNESPLLNSRDGIERADPLLNPLTGLFEIDEFATYASFTIGVSTVLEDPVALFTTDPNPPNVGTTHPYVTFDGSSSYDPDGGSITLFEWDFNWDGIPADFNPDISGTDPVIEYSYSCIEGVYTAALRVTDDDSPAGVSAIASVDVTVDADLNSGSWEGSTQLGFEEATFGDQIIMTGQMLNTDSTGISHVITYDSDWLLGSNIYHRTFDGTNLSTKESLHFGYKIAGATSALDSNDDLHIVWLRYDQSAPSTIEHLVYSNGSFGTVTTLHTTPVSYQSMWINIQNNPDGNIMVVWMNCNGDWLDSRFMYTVNNGSGFTTPDFASGQINLRLNTEGSWHHLSPCIAATPDNKFHLVFYQLDADLSPNRVIYEMIFDGASWTSPSVVFDDQLSTLVSYDLSLAAGSDGDLHLIGCQLWGLYIEYIRYDATTGLWSSPVDVGIAGWGNFADPAVEVDDAGNVHAVWQQETDHLLKLKVFCESASESEILALPEITIDNTTTLFNQKHPDVAWDADKNLIAIYQDEWQADFYSYFNRFVYD